MVRCACFEALRGLSAGSDWEIQIWDAINIHGQLDSVDTVCWNMKSLDFGELTCGVANDK